ncbi:LysE family translocator [Magnetococcus sp. PR-3]|uniref:LysE family translocator n=1 Tax=Magnetococcus sp. PR-3 TaxID=3120355 RepID=UPI002FCE583C
MIATLIILATVTFVSMMSPGPDMMLVIKYGGERDRWPAVACITGICCGLLVHIGFSILGIATMIAASATLFTTIKLMGAAYLVYIGVNALFSSNHQPLDHAYHTQTTDPKTAFRDGLLCNVLNPKVTLFILAVFTQMVEPSTPFLDKMVYGLFIVLEAFVVWTIFTALVRTKWMLAFIQKNQVAIDRITGLVLIGFGSSLALGKDR